MATTAVVYGLALKSLGEGKFDFVNDDLFVLLTTSSYTPNKHTHQFISHVTNEIDTDVYPPGGVQLQNVTWIYNSSTSRMELSCDPTTFPDDTWSNVRYAVVYKDTGSASTSPLLSYLNFETNQSVSGTGFYINWAPGGLFRINATITP